MTLSNERYPPAARLSLVIPVGSGVLEYFFRSLKEANAHYQILTNAAASSPSEVLLLDRVQHFAAL